MAVVRILVVDDEGLVLSATSRMLESVGFEVESATSGLEALEVLAQSGAIDLVLTDVNMPGMSGVELAKQIATRHSDIGVLLVSGKEPMADVMSELPARYRFLRKPYGIATLTSSLEGLLPG